MTMQTHYLIIGSGVAGLTLAIKLAERFPERKITIVTKAGESESNTRYAQGGIAIVTDGSADSYEKHIQDTLDCGDGLCNEAVVRMVVREGPQRLKELLDWGARFDRDAKGQFDLGREGGHSANRVVHHKDQTGAEIERAILRQVHRLANVQLLDHHFAIDLFSGQNQCFGAMVLDTKTQNIALIQSAFTILATGGIGQAYGHTTNPAIATGDGIAMAYRAGAQISDMEFIQFHPTAFYNGQDGAAFLISEAVRGFGAQLRTKDGRYFMLDYDPRGALASRDVVSQAIHTELGKSDDACVFLDCTELDTKAFCRHFPMIYQYCLDHGVDIAKDWIPVLPAQHYLCGGIAVDVCGRTSVVNLLACGECSYTGLHGANRLASNSLLEALVYSQQIYEFLCAAPAPIGEPIYLLHCSHDQESTAHREQLESVKRGLQSLLRQDAGIIRNDTDLKRAALQLEAWQTLVREWVSGGQTSVALYELFNLLLVAHLIVRHSLAREENRGGFIKTTHPKTQKI